MSARQHRISARDGLRLAALEWPGDPDALPILCLPGICRTGRDFEALAERHAGRRRVVALDYVGHGDSDRAPAIDRYRPEHAVSDVLDCCAALGVHRAVLVGTSFGGLLTMFLSLIRPRLIRAAVLNDIGPKVDDAGFRRLSGFVGRDPGFRDIDEAVPVLMRAMPGMPLRDPQAWRRFAELTYRRGEDGLFHPRWDTRLAEVMRAGPPQTDFGPVFRGLGAVPVMLIWGMRSEFLGAATVSAMERDKPDLEVLAVADSGHAPTLSEPEVTPRLDAFLRSMR